MGGKWRQMRWGDLATLEYGQCLRGYEDASGPYPVYGTNGRIGRHTEFLAHGPGVIIGRKGAYRGVHFCTTPFFVIDTAFYLKPKTPFDMRWAYYQLVTQNINRMDSGSAIPSTSRNDFYSLPVNVPPLPIQRRIAGILGALDDKIELNRRMSRTLEQMARALFKSWFVDFDPVRAKMEGRWRKGQSLPGLPAHLYDLFPDRLVESELGESPEGWGVGGLGDIADNPRHSVKPDEVPATTPYIGLEHMPRRCIALDVWGQAGEVASQKTRFSVGDILFGKLRPYFHKVGLAPIDGVCSTDILVIVPKSVAWHSYVLSLVSSEPFVDYTDAHSAGTKMPRTTWADMGRYPLALPPLRLAEAFQGHVGVLHQRITANVLENRRLAALRDALLPKLLSREIDVSALEGLAEEVL